MWIYATWKRQQFVLFLNSCFCLRPTHLILNSTKTWRIFLSSYLRESVLRPSLVSVGCFPDDPNKNASSCKFRRSCLLKRLWSSMNTSETRGISIRRTSDEPLEVLLENSVNLIINVHDLPKRKNLSHSLQDLKSSLVHVVPQIQIILGVFGVW